MDIKNLLNTIRPYVMGWASQAFWKASTMKSVSAAYTVAASDQIVLASGTFTVMLPAAMGSGAVYVVINSGAGTITVDGNGADTINGAATASLAAGQAAMLLDAAIGGWRTF